MNIKTGVLAAVAALSLAVPAAALAQPVYGAPGFVAREEIRRDEGRRFDRARDFRGREDLRRPRWDREHDDRYGRHAYR